MKIIQKLKQYWAELSILLVTVIIFITNFTPGTYLLGWDSLQTELNPTLGIKRAVFSVWQEYQSFGLVAGMAHAADLVRAVVIFFMSCVLPQNMVRYSFHISMLFAGTLGTYFLLKYLFKDQAGKLLPLLGALFYLLNFNLIQIFYLPFEPFSIFAGILPWNILVFLQILEQGITKKNIIKLIVLSILSTPAFVAQQTFVVLMFLLGLIGLGKFIQERSKKIVISSALFIVTVLLINSFWILPQIYFLKDNGSVVKTSKISQLATGDVLYRNRDKGDVLSFLSNTGFFYESTGLHQQPIFAPWKAYRETLPIEIVIYVLAGITILGLFSNSKYRIPFALCYILIGIALLSNTPGIKQINDVIRLDSFINQVFRSPFTKFAVPYALVSSYFFCAGVVFILDLVQKKNPSLKISYLVISVATFLVIISAFPVFQSQYFSPEVKVTLPDSYTKLFSYFKTVDKNKRIALLPEYTFWGWLYQNWGYDGSGFIWYGIEQPIVSRNFDMWSAPSEGYFWEAKEALESEDITAYNNVLKKYQIDYVILDESVAPVITTMKAIQYDRLKTVLAKDEMVSLDKKYGFISVYKVDQKKTSTNFISTTSALPNIGPQVLVTNNDTAYKNNGSYVTTYTKPFEKFYPFLDFTTQTRPATSTWEIHESAGYFQLVKPLPFNTKNYNLSFTSGEFNANLYINNTPVSFMIPYSVFLSAHSATIQFPKVLLKDFIPVSDKSDICVSKNGNVSYVNQKDGALEITAKNGTYGCASYELKNIDQRYGYLISVNTKNISGQRLFLSIVDQTKNQPYIEDRLSSDHAYYVISNRFEQGLGYSLYFQASSLKNIPSTNGITALSAYLIPYDQIKSLFLQKKQTALKSGISTPTPTSKKLNYYTYTMTMASGKTQELILGQAYDAGWHAYGFNYKPSTIDNLLPFLFGKEIKNHVLVNNWANGWTVKPEAGSQKPAAIIIIFLPQYLEYAGFILLGVGILVLSGLSLVAYRKRSQRYISSPSDSENQGVVN